MFPAIFDSPDYRLKFSTTSTRYTKLHEGDVLDKKTRLNALSNGCPASPSSQLWAWAVSGAARSRQQWTGEHHRQAKTHEKSTIKRVLSYVR